MGLTEAVVAPPVPERVTSPVEKPLISSLNTTSNTIGLALVGSSCDTPSLIVTVGLVRSIVSSFVVMSVPVFPARSVAVAVTL